MCAYEPVPRPQLRPGLDTDLNVLNPVDLLRILFHALWYPQRFRVYLDAAPARQWPLLIQSNVVALLSTAAYLTVIAPFYLSLLSEQFSGSDTFALISAALAMSGIGAGAATTAAYWNHRFDSAPSLCVSFGMLTATFIFPIFVRMKIDIPWVPGVDMLWIALAATWAGITANLIAITLQLEIFSLDEYVMMDGAAVFFAFMMTSFIIWISAQPVDLASIWLPLFGTSLLAGGLFHLALHRPLDWLYGQMVTQREYEDGIWYVPAVTSVTIDAVEDQLILWLDLDFRRALETAVDLWINTFQHQAILRALQAVLETQDSNAAMKNVVALIDSEQINVAQSIFRTNRITFSSNAQNRRSAAEQRQSLREKRRGLVVTPRELTLSSDVEWMIAGCHYMRLCYPDRAAKSFRRAGNDGLIKELALIADALDILWNTEELTAQPNVKLPQRPASIERRRSWELIDELTLLARDFRAIRYSRNLLNWAPAAIAVSDRLDDLRDQDDLPYLENPIIGRIVLDWSRELSALLNDALPPGTLRPVSSPFVYSRPLTERDPREKRLSQLGSFETIATGPDARSFIVYGPKLIGKSSFLNSARERLGNRAQMLVIDFRQFSQGSAALPDFAHELCRQLSVEPPPAQNVLSRTTNPTEICFHCIQQALDRAGEHRIVVALDHAETLTQISVVIHYRQALIGLLRSLHQKFPQVIFVFTTSDPRTALLESPDISWLHNAPFITLRRLTLADTRRLLHFATDTLKPRYQNQAIGAIHGYTSGHPLLIQMIADQIINQHNLGRIEGQRDPFVSMGDVLAARNDPDFQHRCREYSLQLLEPARTHVPDSDEILLIIAQAANGIETASIWQLHGGRLGAHATIQELETSLSRLEGYDLIYLNDATNCYSITIQPLREAVLFIHV